MLKDFNFFDHKICKNSRPLIIAEAAVEHLGSLNVAKIMAEKAKEVGADFIKYQIHIPEEEMLPNLIKFWGGSLDEILEKYNLKIEDHAELIKYCKKININYLCTPFCPRAVQILDSLGVRGFKTGSGEFMNFSIMNEISKTKKPVIVSSGMSSKEDMDEANKYFKKINLDYMLMNCTSIYPSPYSKINLRLIKKISNDYKVYTGHSDHTPDIYTVFGAVALGAKVIEKHFTLTRDLKGPDHKVSIEPSEFKIMIDGIRKIYEALGTENKILDTEEVEVQKWARHSLVSIQEIPKNTDLSSDMVTVKRPGTGIPAKLYSKIHNYKSKKIIKKNSIINWSDVIEK